MWCWDDISLAPAKPTTLLLLLLLLLLGVLLVSFLCFFHNPGAQRPPGGRVRVGPAGLQRSCQVAQCRTVSSGFPSSSSFFFRGQFRRKEETQAPQLHLRVMDWILFANSKVYLHRHQQAYWQPGQRNETAAMPPALHPVTVHMNYEQRQEKEPGLREILARYWALQRQGKWPQLMREQEKRFPGGRVSAGHQDWVEPGAVFFSFFSCFFFLRPTHSCTHKGNNPHTGQRWISRRFRDDYCPYPLGSIEDNG